jgi:ADP-ribosylglycohydrolase
MAALAIGDAMGDIGRSDEYRRRYGIVTNMYPGAASTDDTEFAVLTARTILDSKGVVTHESVSRAWRRYIVDAGGMLARGGRPLYGAVQNLERGLEPPQSGIDNVLNNDDGAAMRAAAFGVVFAGDPKRAGESAGVEAQVSHSDSGVWAAQAVAAAVAVAMVDGSPEEIEAALFSFIPDGCWLSRSMEKARGLCSNATEMREVWEQLHTEFCTPEHAAVEEALPQIYGISHMTGTVYSDGMFWAANFGRDADTIAAVVGAIAGARHGRSVIPEPWIDATRKPSGTCLAFAANEDMVQLGSELAGLAQTLG